MRYIITIDAGNAAFFDVNGEPDMREVSRILRGLAHSVENDRMKPRESFNLRDVNGNTIGKMECKR